MKQLYIKAFSLALIFALYAHDIRADHLLGADLFYTCLGADSAGNANLYEFQYDFYSICGDELSDSMTLHYVQQGDVTHNYVYFDTVLTIENPDYPCLEMPNDVCAILQRYSCIVSLPVSTESYHFIAGGCCRPFTLTNINTVDVQPSFLFHVELKPEAQSVCNNSPIFQAIPPTVVCAGEFMSYPQNAIDPDGDQLVYEFCAPLILPSSAASPMPPYDPLLFVLPDYAPAYPLGLDVISIDPNTGLLYGTPPTVGQFVVGICVSEYRNGELLSTIRRDVQLVVAPCPRLVHADMEADAVNDNGDFILNLCNEQSITMNNLSTQTDYIDDWLWSIDLGTHVEQDTSKNPWFYFESGGSYPGSLVVNPDGFCTDTASFIINVVPIIAADFATEYDVCVAGEVAFINNSYASGSHVESWLWDFGDNTFSNNEYAIHRYEAPGLYEVSLQMENEFGCKDTMTQPVLWQPAPEVILIAPDYAAGCTPLTVHFENRSWPVDSTYQVSWDFGDGAGSDEAISPDYTYSETGHYSVFVSVTSPIGCYVDTAFQKLILVEPKPEANFSYAPDLIGSFNPEVSFYDDTPTATSWEWMFNDVNILFDKNPVYTFADTGLHTVRLVVSDIYNCKDTVMKTLRVIPENTFFMPNAFTPNGDGKNDLFKGKGIFDGITNFRLSIYNRWGSVVFETTNPNQPWNGRHQNNGTLLPQGVYVYKLSFREATGKMINFKDVVTLIR